MAEICHRIIQHIGYDTAPFNIEFFWDAAENRIWLLEINTRISKSHAPLFQMVDGIYHHQVMIDLGLGRCPQFSPGGGQHALAAKFMVRAFADARVTRVPTAAEISSVEQQVPGTRILVEVREGMLLSQMRDQDSYSYELATIFVGADDHAELESRFHACMARLPLYYEELPKA
jgi:biotin carboxylase